MSTLQYDSLKEKCYEKLDKKLDKKFLILNELDKILKNNNNIETQSENYEKLLKQLSYDFLVKKRRDFEQKDLIDGKNECANPANYPEENSIFDKQNHIDCLTTWTEDWEKCSCCDIYFNYLHNLDADIVVLGKDSTGKDTHKEEIEKLGEFDSKDVREYVNKETNKNPFTDENKQNIADSFRYGFSLKGVRTNTNLRSSFDNYFDKRYCISETSSGAIKPKKNKNIFFTNSFVFLSVGKISPSFVPHELFIRSVEEFIIPLLDIIKPKAVIQAGSDVIQYSRNAVYELIDSDNELKKINPNYEAVCKNHKKKFESLDMLLSYTHNKMLQEVEAKEFLYHIKWSDNKTTCFYPINHPSRPKYFYISDSKEDGYYVWSHIGDYIKKS